jgi:tight adherence protein C
MLYLIAGLFACAIMLITLVVTQLVPSRPAAVAQRLVELQLYGENPYSRRARRERQSRRERWENLLKELGERVGQERTYLPEMRKRLQQAGYSSPTAGAVFLGARLSLMLTLGLGALLAAPITGTTGLLVAAVLAILGWVGPSFYLDHRVRSRQREIQLALPDMLDLLVICVEAGLGLNQAIVRVSEEIRHVSTALAQELAMVNLEIRAGQPRTEALRNLGERTGVEDLKSLTTMLIQTDRFGTSVAHTLRVESDTLRVKRRQRAEEAAAKSAIKMLFPLVFCIFPSLFVVILGPAGIQISEQLLNR